MKLSNQQIDAIVSQQENKFDSANKIQAEFTKNKLEKMKAKAKQICLIAKKIDKEVIEEMGYEYTEKRVFDKIKSIERSKIPSAPKFDSDKFKTDLIIASIDSNTMDELKKKLNF
jgi:hypothetical protein